MAEGVGFEPTVRLHVQRFSRPPRSTAPASLHRPDNSGTEKNTQEINLFFNALLDQRPCSYIKHA